MYLLSGTFLVVQPVHSHQYTRAARERKSACMVSANMVSMAMKIPRNQRRPPPVQHYLSTTASTVFFVVLRVPRHPSYHVCHNCGKGVL